MGYVLKSPNDLVREAAEAMEIGHDEPFTVDEWYMIVNCWAANLPVELVEQELQLLKIVFDIPVSDLEIQGILEFQLARR